MESSRHVQGFNNRALEVIVLPFEFESRSYGIEVFPRHAMNQQSADFFTLAQIGDLSNLMHDNSFDKLSLPVLQIDPPAGRSVNESTILKHVQSFLLATSMERSDASCLASLEAQSVKLLSNVRKTFPSVQDATTLTVMALWLYILVTVDDIIESMDIDCAQAVLGDMVTLLASFEHSTSENRADLSSPDLNPYHQLATGACSCPGPIHVSRRERKVLVDFWLRTRRLLQPHHHRTLGCLHAVTDVFRAMSSEAQFRQSDDRNPKNYLLIREQTIGTAPFFSLLRSEVIIADEVAAEYKALERCASVAVGLQNDLIGLKRDRLQKNPMNYVLILWAQSCAYGMEFQDSPSQVSPYIKETVELHNSVVKEAYMHWTKIRASSDSRTISVAMSLLDFITKHFRVAMDSSRWKSFAHTSAI